MVHADFTPPSSSRCTVTRTARGWEVSVEQAGVVRQTLYTDWHRVERAVTRIGAHQPGEPAPNPPAPRDRAVPTSRGLDVRGRRDRR